MTFRETYIYIYMISFHGTYLRYIEASYIDDVGR